MDKTEKLGVGLTEAEKQRFRVEAAKRDMSMSELAREILLAELDIPKDPEESDEDPNRSQRQAQTAD
jgi:plasmid stability protein